MAQYLADGENLLLIAAAVLLILALAMKNMLPLRALMLVAIVLFSIYAFMKASTVLIIASLFSVIVCLYRLFEVQNT